MPNFKLLGFLGAAAITLFLVLGGIFGAFYTVDEGSRAVVKRNGAVVEVTSPGLHFKTPFITEVETVSVQSLVKRYEGLQAFSKDMQIGDLLVSVNFTPVSSPDAVRTVVSDYGSLNEYIRRDIDPKIPQVVKAKFAAFTAQSSNENQMELAASILEGLRSVVPTTLVTIDTVQVEDIGFSDKFEASMEARKLAENEVETEKQKNFKAAEVNKQTVADAKATAEAAKAAADATAYATTQQAAAESEAIKLRGAAEADAIRAKAKALADNPSLVDLTKAERWDGVLPTSMVPGSTVPFLGIK